MSLMYSRNGRQVQPPDACSFPRHRPASLQPINQSGAGYCNTNSLYRKAPCMAAVDNTASSATVLSQSPQVRGSASTSVPNSPARTIRKVEDYGDTLQMYDSLRHSHESSVSLLHGQHSRSSSAASFDSFVGQERSFAPGLASLAEEDNIAVYDEEGDLESDDEFPHRIERRSSLHSKIQNDAAPAPGESQPQRRRSRHRKGSSVIPPAVQESASKAARYVKENRGLLMIAASQAAFAAMNAMVSSSGYLWNSALVAIGRLKARQMVFRLLRQPDSHLHRSRS